MTNTAEFHHEPDDSKALSTAVVTATARAHDEDVLDRRWVISADINTEALNMLFQAHNLRLSLRFEADTTTATVTADRNEDPIIKIESHR
jgi:hypothetical protein